jgi:predicted Zn-dependent protease
MFGGAPDRAMETLQPGLDARPDSVPLLAIRAAVKGRLNDSAGAIADGERALQLAPADETTIIVLAGLYSANDRADDARTLLEGSLGKLPRSTDLREVLAQYYAQHDALPKAEQMLVDLVRMQPKQAAARVTLARFYVSTDRVDDAERIMRTAVRDLPENGALPTALVQLLAERRGLPAAEAELHSMIARQPKEYDLQFMLGRYLEQEKKWDEVEALYRKVVEKEGKKGPALVARDRIASMYTQQNRRIEDARALVAEVLAENPRDNEALLIRSSMALGANDAKAAIVDLRALARDHPENVAVQRQLARAYLMSGEGQLGEDLLKQVVANNPADANARFDLAQYFLQSGRPLQARSLTDALVQQDPKSLDFQQAAFKAAMAGKDYSAAADAVAAIDAAAPEKPIGPFLAGVLADGQGKGDEAVRQYTRALELEPRAQEPLSVAVRQLVLQKKGDKALQLIDGIVAKAPENAFALNLRGELLAGQQRWPEAITALQAASQAAPQWWQPYHNLALAHMGQKDADGAVQILKDAASKLEQSEPLAVDLATLLLRMGRQDDANAAYEALVAKHPESDIGANNLAMLLVTYRDDPASLKRAGELADRFAQSRSADYLDTRGWVLFRQGKAPEAVPALEQAVALAPEAAAARYHLALAQFAAGQKQSARDNLERALQSKQPFEGMVEARAKLAQWKQAG